MEFTMVQVGEGECVSLTEWAIDVTRAPRRARERLWKRHKCSDLATSFEWFEKNKRLKGKVRYYRLIGIDVTQVRPLASWHKRSARYAFAKEPVAKSLKHFCRSFANWGLTAIIIHALNTVEENVPICCNMIISWLQGGLFYPSELKKVFMLSKFRRIQIQIQMNLKELHTTWFPCFHLILNKNAMRTRLHSTRIPRTNRIREPTQLHWALTDRTSPLIAFYILGKCCLGKPKWQQAHCSQRTLFGCVVSEINSEMCGGPVTGILPNWRLPITGC